MRMVRRFRITEARSPRRRARDQLAVEVKAQAVDDEAVVYERDMDQRPAGIMSARGAASSTSAMRPRGRKLYSSAAFTVSPARSRGSATWR